MPSSDRYAGLVLLVVACSPSVELTRAPVAGDTRGAVLLRAFASGDVAADAFDFDGNGSDTFLAFGSSAATAAVLEYDCPLSDLALSEGRMTPAPDGHLLPAPRRARVATSNAGWIEQPAIPAPFDALRIREGVDRPPSCTTFTTSALPIGIDGRATFLIPIAPGRLVLGLQPPGLTEVTEAGVEPLRVPGAPARAAVRRDDGELWFVGDGGRVARGPDIDHLTPATSSSSTASGNIALASSRGDAPLELFMATQEGLLQRFDGSAWVTVFRGAPAGPDGRVGVTWLGPGQAIAVGIEPPNVVRYTNGAIGLETLPSLVREAPIAVASLAAHGVLIGTNQGTLYREEGGRWIALLAEQTSFASVRQIVALESQVYYGGQLGLLRETREDLRRSAIDCPSIPLETRSIEALVAHDGVLVGTGGVGTDAFVVFARPERVSACRAMP